MLALEIIGHLGQDAVIKDFGGQKYVSFSVAHSESYTDANQIKHENTTWVNCLKYGESKVIDYLKKGTPVFVRGELSTKIYDSKGTLRVAVNCRVRELTLLGGRKEGGQAPETPVSESPVRNEGQEDRADDLPF
jgi:single-strand DNA-binding protein